VAEVTIRNSAKVIVWQARGTLIEGNQNAQDAAGGGGAGGEGGGT
jgi:hypothetical protein